MLHNRTQKLAMIHIAKKQLALDDAAYRAVLSGAGLNSAAEITTEAQYRQIMSCFKTLGFQPKGTQRTNYAFKTTCKGGGKARLTARQEYYIRGLWDLASRIKTEQSLKRLIYRIAHVIDISHLTVRQASAVILALRDICQKAGYNPDAKPAE